MTNDYNAVWDRCLRTIKKEVTGQSYKTWFEPIKAVSLNGEILTIQVPNKFFYEWLEEHFVSVLQKAIFENIGNNAQLEYQILVENHRKIGRNTREESSSSLPKTLQGDEIKNPFVIPGLKKMAIDPQLSNHYTFDKFILGGCNRLAASAGKAIAHKPGGTSFNPLVIYGDVGLGKTHLAQAIGHESIAQSKKSQVLYVSTERFTNQVIQAIKNNAVNDFMNFYHMIDILIVDDIHFLANRPKTQEIFFNIFNQLHQSGKQIILTMDRAPKDLVDVEERLVSRFKWGLAAELTAPDYETRYAILKSKMRRENLDLPEEVLQYISYNVKNNIRELEGVLISLVAQATLNEKEIDLELTRDVVGQFIKEESKQITVENIKKLVADELKVPIEKLHSKTRKRDIVVARQISMYLAKSFTDFSLKNIGDEFGGRDHSTVIYSVKAVQDLMDIDDAFKNKVSDLEKQVKLSMM